MKLYQVPRDTRVRLVNSPETPPFNFHHVDGMYSFCTDDEGNIFHVNASAEVIIVKEEK